MQNGYAVMSVDKMTGKVAVQAIVTYPKDGLNAADRAADLVERLQLLPSEGRDLDYYVASAPVNASNFELGVLENLGELTGADFVQAAKMSLKRLGVVKVPDWLSVNWVVEQLRTRHGVPSLWTASERMLRIDLSIPKQAEAPEDEGFQETDGF